MVSVLRVSFSALTLLMTCPARPDTIPLSSQTAMYKTCTDHPKTFCLEESKEGIYSRSRSAGKCPLKRGVFMMLGNRGGGAGSSGASPCQQQLVPDDEAVHDHCHRQTEHEVSLTQLTDVRVYFCRYFFWLLIFVFSVLAKRLAGKSIFEMTYFMSSWM